MNAFKKTAVATVLAISSLSVFSAVTTDGKRFYVDGIIPNSQAIENNLLQWRTGYNYSCGPTSLLFIDNHYVRQYTGSPAPHLTTLQGAKDAVVRVYGRIGVSPTSVNGTTIDQLATVARAWGYTNIRRLAASNTVTSNIDNLMMSLSRNQPALAPLSKTYAANPLKPYNHIVIIFAYNKMPDENGRAWNDPNNTRNMDLIEYYEPYYGYMRTVPRKDILLPAATRAFDIANFSYLQVGR